MRRRAISTYASRMPPLRRLAFLSAVLVTVAPLLACPGEEAPPPREPTYANVTTLLRQSCALSSSCHGGSGQGKARLNLAQGLAKGDVRPALAASACEYPPLKLVEPGAPERSWLYLKISSAHAADGKLAFQPDPAWKPDLVPEASGKLPLSECPLTEGGAISFGALMPYEPGRATPLPAEDVELVRSWIARGAPGP